MVDNFLDEVREELLNIERNYQKAIISLWTANRSYSISETRIQAVKKIKQTAIDELKVQSITFLDTFSTSAKGEWVDKAKKVMEEVIVKFDELN